MSLKIRRGTESQRATVTFDQGELVYATDTYKLYIGDGSTVGGKNVLANAVDGNHGIIFDQLTQTLQATNSGGLSSVSADSSPSLGGNLNLNGHNISGTGNISATGNITGTSLASGNFTVTSSTISVNNNTLTLSHPSGGASINHVMNRADQHYYVTGVTTGLAAPGTNMRVSRGSTGTPAAVTPGDILSYASLNYGHDGTDYVLSSAIAATVDPNRTVATGRAPGALALITYPDGVTQKGLYVGSSGWTSINNIGVTGATLDVNGFMKLAMLTTAITSPATGMIAVADGVGWNPTNTGVPTLVIRLGGQWKTIVTA